jgi:hypothetical protein
MWYLDWHPIGPNACINRCRLNLRSGGSIGFGLGRCVQGVPRPETGQRRRSLWVGQIRLEDRDETRQRQEAGMPSTGAAAGSCT